MKIEIEASEPEVKSEDQSVIETMRDRFKTAWDAVEDNYNDMLSDLEFLDGGENQWDAELLSERNSDKRPSLTINKLPAFVDRVVGDQRQNRPAIKVRPVDSKADPETAKVLGGLIRNIESTSQADVAYDHAFECAASCGMGVFRIITEYVDDDMFDQAIRIERVLNPFTVVWDPDAQRADKSDAKYAFVTSKMSISAFKEQYPNASLAEWDADKDDTWTTKGEIRVCEYFVKEPKQKRLYQVQLPDGTTEVLDADPAEKYPDGGFKIVKERAVDSYDLTWYKCNGNEVLESPVVWPGRHIPLIPVWGKELTIENKTKTRGVIRHSKDPQRLYNYNRSAGAELQALAPLSPFIMTPKMIAGFEKSWKLAPKRAFPYLLFNPDPEMPGFPQRQFPTQVNTGIQNEIMIADQELHDTTGIQLASMGKKSNEKSGKAIDARAREGDVGSFAYIDNLVRALNYAGRVLIDMMQNVYDTARVERLLEEDGSDRMIPLNQEFQDEKTKKTMRHDITVGRYDVTVTAGPSFQTQREEAATGMIEFLKVFPAAAPIIGDLVVKNLDWPGADDMNERLKKALPPQFQEKDENAEPQRPDPQQVLAMRTQAELAKIEVDTKRAELEKIKKQAIGEELKNRKTQAEIEKIVADTAALKRQESAPQVATFNQ